LIQVRRLEVYRLEVLDLLNQFAALPVGSESRVLTVQKVESDRFCRWTEPRQNGAVLVCARHDALLLLVESQKRN
jgi:hypothetical protein